VAQVSCEYLLEHFKKFEMTLSDGPGGGFFYEKDLKGTVAPD
jgi:hypothetical protein